MTSNKAELFNTTVFHINMEGADVSKVKEKVKVGLDKAEELNIPIVAFPALDKKNQENRKNINDKWIHVTKNLQ